MYLLHFNQTLTESQGSDDTCKSSKTLRFRDKLQATVADYPSRISRNIARGIDVLFRHRPDRLKMMPLLVAFYHHLRLRYRNQFALVDRLHPEI